MSRRMKKILIILSIAVILFGTFFAVFIRFQLNKKDEFEPAAYSSIDEVKALYHNNKDIFDSAIYVFDNSTNSNMDKWFKDNITQNFCYYNFGDIINNYLTGYYKNDFETFVRTFKPSEINFEGDYYRIWFNSSDPKTHYLIYYFYNVPKDYRIDVISNWGVGDVSKISELGNNYYICQYNVDYDL